MQRQAQPFCSLEVSSRKYHGVTYHQIRQKLQFFHTLQNFVQTMWSISGECLLLQNNQGKRNDENRSHYIFYKTQTALTIIRKLFCFFKIFVPAICVLFMFKLKRPKNKSIYYISYLCEYLFFQHKQIAHEPIVERVGCAQQVVRLRLAAVIPQMSVFAMGTVVIAVLGKVCTN